MSERKVLFCAARCRSTQQHDQNDESIQLLPKRDRSLARLYSLHPHLNAFLLHKFASIGPQIRETTVPLNFRLRDVAPNPAGLQDLFHSLPQKTAPGNMR
jgi:hypothetical protein